MPRYVVLYRFTAEGAKSIRDTVQRARQTREQTEKRGFKVQTLLWTRSQPIRTLAQLPLNSQC